MYSYYYVDAEKVLSIILIFKSEKACYLIQFKLNFQAENSKFYLMRLLAAQETVKVKTTNM